ncbi:MAG: hypothetical protein JWR65_1735 [Massilia sp.]|jgi:hypothetical protein|nr:hypothetical protein [Massilia sp.]
MKNIRPIVILVLFFLLAWNVFGHSSNMTFDFDGEDLDGPLGALAGFLFAGGGMIVAALVLLFVGALLAVLFAGLGVMLVLGLGMAALVVAALVSPLLLPFLIPVAIIWFFASRGRRNRARSQVI